MKISISPRTMTTITLLGAIFYTANVLAMKKEEMPILPQQQQSSSDLEKYVRGAIQALQQNIAREAWKKTITLKQIPQKVTDSAELKDARDAIIEEQARMLDAIEDKDISTIKDLANRYTVKVKDKNGQTPLTVVIKHAPNNTTLIQKLIKMGARYTSADRATNIEYMIGNLNTLADAEKFMNDITKEIALFKEQGKEEAKRLDEDTRARVFQRIKSAEKYTAESSREKGEEVHKIDVEFDTLAVIYGKYNELYKKYEEKIVTLGGKEKLIDSGMLEQAKIAANAAASAISLSNYTESHYFKSDTSQGKVNYLKNKVSQIIEILFQVKNPTQQTSIRKMLITFITATGFDGDTIVKDAEAKYINETAEGIKNTIDSFKSMEEAEKAAQSIEERFVPLPQDQQSLLMKYYQDKISELTFIDAINDLPSLEDAQNMGKGIKQMINELPEDKQLELLQLYNEKLKELEEAQ